MTLLEVIKKAEEKQKILGENTAKVYIRRKDWSNVIDPVAFVWVYAPLDENLTLPFRKTSTKFEPSKGDVTNNDWELFTHYFSPKAENKDNKDSKPESTIPSENVTNVINQIVFTKKKLNELLEDTTKIKAMFEKNYGIKFNYFVKIQKFLLITKMQYYISLLNL